MRELLYRIFVISFIGTLTGSFAITMYYGQSPVVMWERPGFPFSIAGFSCTVAAFLLMLLTQRAIRYVGELDRTAKRRAADASRRSEVTGGQGRSEA